MIYDTQISLDDVYETLPDLVGIIINSRITMDRRMIDAGKQLGFIARLGSGKEIIDIPYAQEKGVAVYTSPAGNANSVAEHAMGMLLMLLNKMKLGDNRVREFEWKREENRGVELEGKTIGIIGYGHTGQRMAEKLRGFNVKIMAYDKYKKHFGDDTRYLHECTLDEVIAGSDIITLHVPLTKETTGMVNASFLEACQQGLILINTSRGRVVETQALIDALESGHLAGAALDVFENEKPASMDADEKSMYRKLFSFENTVFTPHVAGWTHESKRKLAEIVLQKIRGLES